MYLNYGLVIKAILFVAGLWWCKEMFGRLSNDISELKESDDNSSRCVIIFLWLLTLGVIVLMINFAWSIVRNIISALS